MVVKNVVLGFTRLFIAWTAGTATRAQKCAPQTTEIIVMINNATIGNATISKATIGTATIDDQMNMFLDVAERKHDMTMTKISTEMKTGMMILRNASKIATVTVVTTTMMVMVQRPWW